MPNSQIDSIDMSDLAAEISASDGRELAPAHQDVLDAIEALKDMADEPAPVVAEFTSGPWQIEPTREPAEASLADLDAALADLDLDTPDLDSEPAPGNEATVARTSTITPALRDLMEKTRDKIYADNLRNGRKAQQKKARQREEYADHIWATERREVRKHEKNPTPDRIREQNNARQRKRRKNRTPEQIAADRKKDRDRKRLERQEKREQKAALASAALEAQALF